LKPRSPKQLPRSAAPELEIRSFATLADWAEWLDEHHASVDALWLKFAKKESGIASITYAEALDMALCYGWIDGQAKGIDEIHWLQRFGVRRPRSKWSKRNRRKAEELIKSGRMKPAGVREVKAAKADGRWDAAYDSPRTATVPPDLQAELDANPDAKAFFATLDGTNRYAILYRIQEAKKPETRARRIAQFVAMLLEKKTIHPPRKKRE
jgi:uncharacterized protein YdeI (YjbR/CyaY-like superfamily)